MADSNINTALEVGIFLVSFGGAVLGLSKWISSIRDNLNKDLGDHKREVAQDLDKVKNSIESTNHGMSGLDRTLSTIPEILRQEIGEQGHAIRSKIHEMELWTRDNFVSNKTFENVLTNFRDVFNRIEGKLDRSLKKDDD